MSTPNTPAKVSITLSYAHAKNILTEVEKDRIVCTYLNSTEPNAIDWDKAAAEYGAASVESYKKGMQNTTKKIKTAMNSGEAPAAAAEGTPAKNNKGGRKRKEKAISPVVESDGEEAAVEEEAPKKKKAKGRKTKAQKAAEAAEAAAAEEGEDDVVKAEGGDDEE